MKISRLAIVFNIGLLVLIGLLVSVALLQPTAVRATGGGCVPGTLNCAVYPWNAPAACFAACKQHNKAQGLMCECLDTGAACAAETAAANTAFLNVLKECKKY